VLLVWRSRGQHSTLPSDSSTKLPSTAMVACGGRGRRGEVLRGVRCATSYTEQFTIPHIADWSHDNMCGTTTPLMNCTAIYIYIYIHDSRSPCCTGPGRGGKE
jgi:hypothetical protein